MSLNKFKQGCARFAEIASELTKLGVQAQQNLEFEYAIAMLKCENLPRTNSTKYETQNILVKFQQNEHTPGTISKFVSVQNIKIEYKHLLAIPNIRYDIF